MNGRRLGLIIFVIWLSCFVYCSEAKAYIDPGAGSYMFQLLIAFLIGGLFVIKSFWRRIKTYFSSLFLNRKSEHDNGDDEK